MNADDVLMSALKRKMPGRLLLAAMLLLSSTVLYFVERADGGDWANWAHGLGMIALIYYLRRFYVDRKAVFLTGFYPIYYSVGMLLSSALVSGGIYMFEIAQFGNQNGIFWVMLAYFVLGLETSAIGYQFARHVHIGQGVLRFSWASTKFVIYALTATALAASSVVFLLYGGPVLQGVDRVTFWRQYVPSFMSFIPTLVLQSFFFAAYYYLWARRDGRHSLLLLGVLLGYLIATWLVLGQKFSAFIIFMNAWFVLLPGIFPNFKVRRSHIIPLAAVILILAASVVVSYLIADREEAFALARIALQAQLLWSVFSNDTAQILLPQYWECYFGCGQFLYGIDFISYKYLPSELYSHYLESGTVLSGFMPSLSILAFGISASLFIHVIMSFALGFVQAKIVSAISKKNMIYGFLLFKLLSNLTLIWFAAMASAIPGLIVTLAVIIFYHILFKYLPLREQAMLGGSSLSMARAK